MQRGLFLGMMNAAWGVDSDTICATVEYDIADTLESSVRTSWVALALASALDVEEDHADVAYEEDRDARFDLDLRPPDVRRGRRDGDGVGAVRRGRCSTPEWW